MSAVASGVLLALSFPLACAKERRDLFTRNAPPVDEAISALDAGDASAAFDLLSGYLSTGKCENGAIGTPARVHDLPNATFDLGIALFKLGEKYGKRFGEEASPVDGGPSPEETELAAKRDSEVDCALRVVRVVGGQATLPSDLRARAFYLAGNLEFLRGDYKTAVEGYDSALRIVPGLPVDASDTIGRDAAHNRAIALRRIQDEENEKDAGNDAEPPDAGQDGGGDGGKPDSGPPDGGAQDGGEPPQQPDAGPNDAGQDAAPNPADAGQDGGDQPRPPPESQQQPEPPREQRAEKNERMLDELEQAPTFQEHDAKNRALMRPRLRMEDK